MMISFVFTADTVWGVNVVFKQVVVKTAVFQTKTSV